LEVCRVGSSSDEEVINDGGKVELGVGGGGRGGWEGEGRVVEGWVD
jgi:hypothetical protein